MNLWINPEIWIHTDWLMIFHELLLIIADVWNFIKTSFMNSWKFINIHSGIDLRYFMNLYESIRIHDSSSVHVFIKETSWKFINILDFLFKGCYSNLTTSPKGRCVFCVFKQTALYTEDKSADIGVLFSS